MSTDYNFQLLFDSLTLIGTPMYRASDSERALLDRIWERLRTRMIKALYEEV